MKCIKILNFENYNLYENGDIINLDTNKKISISKNRNSYFIRLNKLGKTYSINILRLIYENFNNIKLTNTHIIKFKNETIKNKFHYTNLEKINRKDMFKNINHLELDNTKEWKIVKNYIDYKISNYGDIFSIKSNKFLQPMIDENGYYNIKLINIDNRKKMSIHRLVYDAFNGIKDNDKVIDHIDRDKTNNNINNLREVSLSINAKNCNKKKITLTKIHQYSLDYEFIKEWISFEEIKKILNYDVGNISRCCTGKLKSAYGFIWKNPKIIDDLINFKVIDTKDNNKFSNYKINKKGVVINNNNIILKQNINSGYYRINLTSDNGKPKSLFIHKLVALTFLENQNNYDIVNHKDENKLNNNIKNLEWVNHIQNITYSQGKKINQIDINIDKIIKTFNSMQEAYRELNKTYGANIRLVCEGKRKFAFGFRWSFFE